nr:hypothetical protein [Amycolatopsis keratiniphila]
MLANARAYKETVGEATRRPRRRIAVVACMDARISVYRLLGLREGEAHVIRNAGGGMRTFTDTDFARQIEASTGIRPPWAAETFTDSAQDVRQCIARCESGFRNVS